MLNTIRQIYEEIHSKKIVKYKEENFWIYKHFNLTIYFLFSDNAACYADQDDDIIFEDFARLRLKGESET